MTQLLVLMKYWGLFITIVEMIEAAVPDDTPGTAKLDMAMKFLLKQNAELQNFGPALEQMFAFAKVVYTGLKALRAPAQ